MTYDLVITFITMTSDFEKSIKVAVQRCSLETARPKFNRRSQASHEKHIKGELKILTKCLKNTSTPTSASYLGKLRNFIMK